MKNKIIKTLNKIEDTALIVMFAAMVGIIFFQVVMRYVFNNSSSWSEELGKFLFVWLSWIGISIGHRRKEHIRITLVVDKLPPKWKIISEALSELVLIIICGITLYYGIMMIGIQKTTPYAGIKISTAWGYLSLVLGCGIFILRATVYFIESIKSLSDKDTIPEGESL
ncbi:MAG: TRAP transporter small permease [Tissierellia bacterium]|nr:TRAP transporter small permease [Tissierellia bacterium]